MTNTNIGNTVTSDSSFLAYSPICFGRVKNKFIVTFVVFNPQSTKLFYLKGLFYSFNDINR